MKPNLFFRLVLAASLAAGIGVLAQIRFSLGPVPYTMQNMGVVMASLLLPPYSALLAVGLYLFLIFIGFPLASGLMGGPLVLIGYTGGYLWGFLLSAPFYSYLSRKYLEYRGKGLWEINYRDGVVLLLLSAICFLPVYLLGFLFFYHYAVSSPQLFSWASKASSMLINLNSRGFIIFVASVLIFLPQDLLMDHVLGITLAKEISRILRERGVNLK